MLDFGQVKSERKLLSGVLFMISTYSMRHRYENLGEFGIAKVDGRTMRLRRRKFFWTVFWSTKWRVGDDGCAIFLFFKKTRHSI